MAAKIRVGVLMGSDSNLSVMRKCLATLKEFGVGHEVNVLSAHRTPDLCAAYVKSARGRGLKVIIAAAGGAAHLAGAAAAHTTLPVIGVPLASTSLQGLDALLSTVQMPPGVPVAAVAIGEYGAVNAALLAVQILALEDAKLARRLAGYKAALARKAAQKNRTLQENLARR